MAPMAVPSQRRLGLCIMIDEKGYFGSFLSYENLRYFRELKEEVLTQVELNVYI